MTGDCLIDTLRNERVVENIESYHHPYLQDGYEIVLDNIIPDSVVEEIHDAGYDIREVYREGGKIVVLIFLQEVLDTVYGEKLPHLR